MTLINFQLLLYLTKPFYSPHYIKPPSRGLIRSRVLYKQSVVRVIAGRQRSYYVDVVAVASLLQHCVKYGRPVISTPDLSHTRCEWWPLTIERYLLH